MGGCPSIGWGGEAAPPRHPSSFIPLPHRIYALTANKKERKAQTASHPATMRTRPGTSRPCRGVAWAYPPALAPHALPHSDSIQSHQHTTYSCHHPTTATPNNNVVVPSATAHGRRRKRRRGKRRRRRRPTQTHGHRGPPCGNGSSSGPPNHPPSLPHPAPARVAHHAPLASSRRRNPFRRRRQRRQWRQQGL